MILTNIESVPGMTIEPDVPEELLKKAKAFTDTAIISICRFSGEGWDRQSSFDAGKSFRYEDPLFKKSREIFEDGDFYLSHAEKAMIEKVKRYFSKVFSLLFRVLQ